MPDQTGMPGDEQRNSLANQSELRAIFTDCDQPTAPYDGRAMRLTLCRDIAFVALGTLKGEDGNVDTDRFKADDQATIGVDAVLLYETLGAMLRRDDRLALDRLREGSLPASDPRLVVVPAEGQTLGVRRRA